MSSAAPARADNIPSAAKNPHLASNANHGLGSNAGLNPTSDVGTKSAVPHAPAHSGARSEATADDSHIGLDRRHEAAAGKAPQRRSGKPATAPIEPKSGGPWAHRNPKYACPHCEKNPPTKYKLERHLRTHTGEKPFVCEVCHDRFNQKSSRKTHSKIHARAFMGVRGHTKESLENYTVNEYSLESLGYPVQAYVAVQSIGAGAGSSADLPAGAQ
jgi:hypothetical protein